MGHNNALFLFVSVDGGGASFFSPLGNPRPAYCSPGAQLVVGTKFQTNAPCFNYD